MANIYPKYVKIVVKKCPGHIQHVSRTFQKMSHKSILGKIDFDKNEFGKHRILKKNVFHVKSTIDLRSPR